MFLLSWKVRYLITLWLFFLSVFLVKQLFLFPLLLSGLADFLFFSFFATCGVLYNFVWLLKFFLCLSTCFRHNLLCVLIIYVLEFRPSYFLVVVAFVEYSLLSTQVLLPCLRLLGC